MVGTIGLALAWSVRRLPRLPSEFRRWVPVFAATALMVVAFIPGLTGLYDRTVDRFLPGETPAPTDPLVEIPDDEDGRTEPARVALYVGSVEIARDHFPLGAGMGRYGSLDEPRGVQPTVWGVRTQPNPGPARGQLAVRDRHVLAAMVVGEFGVIGVLAYSAFLAGIGLTLWALGRKATDPVMATFVVAGLAVLTAAVIESTATPMFTSPPRSYLLFAALGGDPGRVGDASDTGWHRARRDMTHTPGGLLPRAVTAAAEAISAAERVTAICHENPDADTIGAAIAIARIARALGKEAEVVSADGIEPRYEYLGEGDVGRRPRARSRPGRGLRRGIDRPGGADP